MIELPFKAYQGDEPYLFISYAHKDSERVFSIIRPLREAGYRIWYDEGIDPGSEWPEEIATHLTGASAVLLFVSPRSMESHNVRREVTFGINLRKLMVSVYLEPTEMSAGMSLQLGLNQAVHYYTYKTDAEFFDKLLPALPEKTREESRENAAPAPPPQASQPRPAAFRMPDKLETQTAQPVPAAVPPDANFNPNGMVLPFLPKGSATVYLKSGGETSCPLNCFVIPRENGNYDCLCLNKSLRGNEQYFFGARGNSYRFEDMISIEVSEGSGGQNLLIYLANGERRFFENAEPFEVGGLFGRSFRRYSTQDISKITFDPNGAADITSDLALVTTKSGISFYTPIGMMETIQFAVPGGMPTYKRSMGFQLKETLIEYRKMTTLELDIKVGGMYGDSDISACYTTRSGISETVEFKQHYLPSLSGVNQYGCFHMPFAQVARIDIYAGGREGAPAPTPLPDITWPQPQAQVVPFFPEGCAKITDASDTTYVCPANAVLGADGYGTWQVYDGINMNPTGERFSELFRVANRTSLEELESMELAVSDGSSTDYAIRMRDAAGVTLEGIYSQASANAAPALVFAHGGEKGAVRVLTLKSLKFDRDADAPGVEQAVVYTKNGRAIGMPRGSVVFSGGGANSYPGCCFMLPTGNAVDIGTLRRMMIHDQQTDGGIQRWLVFECDGLRGAFLLPADLLSNYQLYGVSEFGLCNLKAGEDWYLLDMKR